MISPDRIRGAVSQIPTQFRDEQLQLNMLMREYGSQNWLQVVSLVQYVEPTDQLLSDLDTMGVSPNFGHDINAMVVQGYLLDTNFVPIEPVTFYAAKVGREVFLPPNPFVMGVSGNFGMDTPIDGNSSKAQSWFDEIKSRGEQLINDHQNESTGDRVGQWIDQNIQRGQQFIEETQPKIDAARNTAQQKWNDTAQERATMKDAATSFMNKLLGN